MEFEPNRTIRRQTNSRSVKSRMVNSDYSRLAEMFDGNVGVYNRSVYDDRVNFDIEQIILFVNAFDIR